MTLRIYLLFFFYIDCKYQSNRFIHHSQEVSKHILNKNERISVNDLYKLRSEREPHLLIDVRSNAEYEMCHLSESINLHINSLDKNADYLIKKINDLKCVTDDPKSK